MHSVTIKYFKTLELIHFPNKLSKPKPRGVGMGHNKNFMSRCIMTVIIAIINIIMVSLNSTTATKFVKIRRIESFY